MDGEPTKHYDIYHADRSAVLLTGGASRRMGFDKASISVEGEALAVRLARALRDAGWEPSILGRSPLGDYNFHPDAEAEHGPLAALRDYQPLTSLIFVLSCDVPLFDGAICKVLEGFIGQKEAVIPSIDGRLQPLCGLYHVRAWSKILDCDSPRIMDWIGKLDIEIVTESQLVITGGHPNWCRGVNTPSELKTLLASRSRTSE